MAYWKNDEPVGNTCPIIDEVISFIKDNTKEDESSSERIFGRCEHTNALWKLEKIREANATLREWGTNHSMHVSELEEELEDLKTTSENSIYRLEKEIEDLKEQLELAKGEIEVLNDNI